MRSFTLFLSLAILTLTVKAQVSPFYVEFKEALAKNDTARMQDVLKKWRSQTTNEPELYVAYTNYYFKKSRKEILNMSTQQSGDKSVQLKDKGSNKVAGYINGSTSFDPKDISKTLAYIDTGVAKFPNRLDLRFGKSYVYGQLSDWDNFTNQIINTINYSAVNYSEWLWSENKKLDDGRSFMLSSVQDYVNQLYQAGDAQIPNFKKIALTVLKHYPDDVPNLSNLAISSILTRDYEAALPPLLKAEKLAPHDAVILNNIAFCYKNKGDKPNAIKYYNMVVQYGNEEEKKSAKEWLLKLGRK